MHEVMQRVEESAELFRQSAAESEKLGRLSDVSAKQLRETGVMRLLQPTEYGGDEGPPGEVFEAVLKVGALWGSAGRGGGGGGIPPRELGPWGKRAQQGVGGEGPG